MSVVQNVLHAFIQDINRNTMCICSALLLFTVVCVEYATLDISHYNDPNY